MITYIVLGVAVLGIAMYFKPSSNGKEAYRNVSVDDLDNLLKDKNTILIDVRTQKEINQGVIGQPLEIELGVGMKQKMINLDKDKKYILYCRSGKRSTLASKMMSNLGFNDVNNLQGGYVAWKASK